MLTKTNTKAHFTTAKKHLDDPQDLGENSLSTEETKV